VLHIGTGNSPVPIRMAEDEENSHQFHVINVLIWFDFVVVKN
jgi:hypothetical protein